MRRARFSDCSRQGILIPIWGYWQEQEGRNRLTGKGIAAWRIQLICIRLKIAGGDGCCPTAANLLPLIISPKDGFCVIAAAAWTAEICKI